MAIDIKKYSAQLRMLCEDYYFQNISYIEFRIQRNDLFDKIQSEQGVSTGVPFCADDVPYDSEVENDEYAPIQQD